MRRRLLFLLCVPVLLLVGACVADPGGAPPVGPPTSVAAPPTGQADIFAVVLRRYLTTSDNSNLPVGNVFVLDHTSPDVGDGAGVSTAGATTPIATADQRAIVTALADVTPLRFIATADEVLTSNDGCVAVRDDGLLITLGPPTLVGAETQVGIAGFAACLGATGLTYTVAGGAGGWRVTGTTGTSWVA